MSQLSHAVEVQPSAAPELGLTMTQILRNPLVALRASMETLAGEFRADDPRGATLQGALAQVLSLSRDLDALVNYAAPRPLQPLHCKVEEILRAALRGLRFDQTARVKLAHASPDAGLYVDGPLLADCLALLIRNTLTDPQELILLSASHDEHTTTFSLIEGVHDAKFDYDGCGTLQATQDAALDLGLRLARRDVERMHGTLEVEHTALGNTRLVVRMPNGQEPSQR
jgi:signal transduction histidine kinase